MYNSYSMKDIGNLFQRREALTMLASCDISDLSFEHTIHSLIDILSGYLRDLMVILIMTNLASESNVLDCFF